MCYFKKYYTIHPIIIDKSRHLPSKSTIIPQKTLLTGMFLARRSVIHLHVFLLTYVYSLRVIHRCVPYAFA